MLFHTHWREEYLSSREFRTLYNPRSELHPVMLAENSPVADIAQWVASTPSATLRRSINTPTATPGTSSSSTRTPAGTSLTDSPHHAVSSPASSIASTPTTLSSLGNMPTPIPNPEARAIITNPLQMRATERDHRQRQWQLQLQAVSTPRSMVTATRSIHLFGHSDNTGVVFTTGRLMELYMANRWPFMSVSNLEMVRYTMRHVGNALAEGPNLQIMQTNWNTAMHQHHIWSIAFEACTKEILKAVCWIDGPRWILHAKTSTRFGHKSIRLNPMWLNE